MRRWLAWLVQAVWGMPQTLVGALVLVVCARGRHTAFRTACVTEWELGSGLSLGPFVFVPKGYPRRLLVHEYGHCIQSLILGPLYLPIVGLPSLVWSNLAALGRMRHRRHMSYYALPTERWANWLGERVCGEPSMGQAFID